MRGLTRTTSLDSTNSKLHDCISYHTTGGRVQVVHVSDVREDLVEWETQHQDEPKKFASFLHQLDTEVKRASHLQLEICRAGTGPLQLRARAGPLPDFWEECRATKCALGSERSANEDRSNEEDHA
ncbi:hypothetical protein F4678DRAFT_485502 [Xylaria arbuscula]|nr:hypothetical protein F4678DRAFT_485502 [Xylaria arbuscula]